MPHRIANISLFAFLVISPLCLAADPEALFQQAAANGRLANEGFDRCQRFVAGWAKLADPKTGLIPRNTSTPIWVIQDSAADNYPFMVLTAAIVDRPTFDGRMLDILRTEHRLTNRIGNLPDAWSFKKQAFEYPEPNMDRIMFGAAEYIKDGLLPLTEWLGPSPWRDRMIEIMDDMWRHAGIDTPFGKITSSNIEVQGDQLQALSRIYWITGDRKYLDYAIRLGDYYLLGNRHPTRDLASLRLRDHGCEIVSGLVELYVAVHFAMPEKKKQYQKPIHEMLDRILEVGRNEHGLLYDAIDPKAGKPIGKAIADTWGYNLNAHYAVHLLDNRPAYRDAVLKALSCLNEHYRNYKWEGDDRDSADGHADSIESALNLYNREPVESAARWVDHDMQVMWAKQQPDGVIEGWHGDGNFARTTIMYCLWKTQGITIRPWREDVVFGAVQRDGTLYLSIRAGKDWTGQILFDGPRHRENMRLPIDYPRINQFPEWFTVQSDQRYEWVDEAGSVRETKAGRSLREGVPVSLRAGVEQRIEVGASDSRRDGR